MVPSGPKWLKQVHGVKVVDAETAAPEEEADASTAITPNTVCVVQVADCLPVLITDKTVKPLQPFTADGEVLRAAFFRKPLSNFASA